MFSSDKNIESFAELIEALKRHIGIRTELIRLDVVDKVVRIITALSLTLVFLLITILILIYLSFAAAYALSSVTGSMSLGFLAIAAFYLLLLMIIFLKRKSWIEQPLVKFLASILIE